MENAKIVTVKIETGDAGMLHATSPEMRELFVSGETIEELLEAVPTVIEAIFGAHGKKVSVFPTEKANEGAPPPWVVVDSGALENAI